MARSEGMAAFWGDGDYGVQQPLTDETVREAEQVLGVTLPSALLALLRLQNGGIVAADHDAFPASRPTSWSEDHVPLDALMGIGRREGMTSLLDTPYLLEEWGMPAQLVLLSGDGRCWLRLDYRISGRSGEPSVTWFDTDFDGNSEPITRSWSSPRGRADVEMPDFGSATSAGRARCGPTAAHRYTSGRP